MPRIDQRTQRGLQVARRMQAQGAPRKGSLRELVEFGRRLTPQDLQTLSIANAVGGPDAVARMIAPYLSPETVEATRSAIAEAGLEPLAQTVREEIATENTARGAREYVGFVQAVRSNPALGAAAEGQLRTQGREGVAQMMRQMGVSEAGVAVALAAGDAAGWNVPAMLKNVDAHVAAERQTAESEAAREALVAKVTGEIDRSIESATPGENDPAPVRAIKQGSPLEAVRRDPEFHNAAAAWLAPRVDRLRAAGLMPKSGSPGDMVLQIFRAALAEESPAGAMNANRRIGEPKVEHAEGMKLLADVLGEPVGQVETVLSMVRDAELSHGLLKRRAKSDAETRDLHSVREPTGFEKEKADREVSRRETLERAYTDQVNRKPRTVVKDENTGQLVEAPPEAVSMSDTGPRRRALARELARQTGEPIVLEPTADGGRAHVRESFRQAKERADYRKSRTAALSDAYDRSAERSSEPERPAAPEREFTGRDEVQAATSRRAGLEAAWDQTQETDRGDS